MIGERVSGYSFRPDDLDIAGRQPGISAFMRIRNGADFLEATIRSHIDQVDEVVAVHNRCTDTTPTILARLAQEYGPKLRIIDYADPAHPPGSEGHAREPENSPASFVNMSNLALARTTRSVVMKLDDDHLAMPDRFKALATKVRRRLDTLDEAICFSGINLARGPDGKLAIPAAEPMVGTGDHYFLRLRADSFFVHDPRFERFRHVERRTFGDITYWHLKYLKPGLGFANHEGEAEGRFARKKQRMLDNRRFVSVEGLAGQAPAWLPLAGAFPLTEKARLRADRWKALRRQPPDLQHATDALVHILDSGPST